MPPMPDTSPKPRALLVYANPAITASPVPPYGMERVAQVAPAVAGKGIAALPFFKCQLT